MMCAERKKEKCMPVLQRGQGARHKARYCQKGDGLGRMRWSERILAPPPLSSSARPAQSSPATPPPALHSNHTRGG